ncbi:MAG: hypothetical protein ACFCGT_22860 [Sandaracinaceae bacterium]
MSWSGRRAHGGRRRAARWAALLLGLAVAPRPALADGRGEADGGPLIRVLAPDPEWLAALRVALEPWGLTIEAQAGHGSGGEGVAVGRAASGPGVVAVLWIDGAPPTLHAYLVDSDRILQRDLARGPPYDPPTAAAVALSAKTLLRHTPLAPEGEQASPLARPTRPQVRVAVGGEARFGAFRPRGVEPRFSLAPSVWPALAEDPRHAYPLGLGLVVTAGVPRSFDGADAAGRWQDTAVAATLDAALRLDPDVDLGVAVHLGGRVTALRATLEEGTSTTRRRLEPLGRVVAEVGVWAHPAVRIGLWVAVEGALGAADYTLDGRRVAREESAAAAVGIRGVVVALGSE